VKDQPKLAMKHLLSVVKPAQLKEVCENDFLLDQIELRNDFYGFVKHLRKTAADADRWVATNRTGKDTKSTDKASPGGPRGAIQVALTQVLGRPLSKTVHLPLEEQGSKVS
jgi:hypothetical protein